MPPGLESWTVEGIVEGRCLISPLAKPWRVISGRSINTDWAQWKGGALKLPGGPGTGCGYRVRHYPFWACVCEPGYATCISPSLLSPAPPPPQKNGEKEEEKTEKKRSFLFCFFLAGFEGRVCGTSLLKYCFLFVWLSVL